MDDKLIQLATQLPPGFRFHPSDEELIVHYLMNKVNSMHVPSVIGDIDLYKYHPWDLPGKALFGTDEWYFFSPRDRKYPNGERPNRAAASGYWKATGTDKPIVRETRGSSSCGIQERIGVKKGLVFYVGRPPRGIKTDWIMIEYRLLDTMSKWSSFTLKGSSSMTMRLDDWVLCRVRRRGSNLRNVWDHRNSSSANTSHSLIGWPISNSINATSQEDILSMILTQEDINQELDLFSPNLKRKLPEDHLRDDYTHMPWPLKKISKETDQKNW